MKPELFFKKKTQRKMFCSVCASQEFKAISINKNSSGRLMLIQFSLHCKNDHVTFFKEHVKPV